METCIFCDIAAGTIAATFVYHDEDVIAFDDVAPQAPVHTLIVPRAHHEHLGDRVSDRLLGALFAAVPRVAEAKGIADSGYRTIVNCGPDANQTVPHLHIHVLGGRPMAHGMVCFVDE